MTLSAIAVGDGVTALSGPALALGAADRRLRSALIEAVHSLHDRKALDFGGAANASVRLVDRPGCVLVTSRGLPRDLGDDDFGIVTLGGGFVGGKLGKGIRSVIAMHTHAYRREGVNAAIHTHSPYATVFAVAHQPIPAGHYEPLVNRGQRVDVPVSRYGNRNSGEMVGELDRVLADHPDTHAVLLANHGLLVFDEDIRKAADLVVTIDEAAALFLRARALGGSRPIDR